LDQANAKIKVLKSKNREIRKDKEQIDSAAEELFERCKMYETQCEQLMHGQSNTSQIEEIEKLKRENENYESKQQQLEHELRSLRGEIELLTNPVDNVSEIVSEQGFMPYAGMNMLQGDILIAVESLAKDIGYSFTRNLGRSPQQDIE
jgi:predicted RNase H-like nuclease (RuvC/YqgF family)